MRKILLAVVILGALAAGLYAFIRGGFSAREEPTRIEAAITGTLRDWSVPSRYEHLPNPVSCSEQVFKQAEAHWADHCATCHANDGSGDTMLGRTMYPRPPDMRIPATQNESDGELYYTIKNGVRLSGMPAFGKPGDDDTDSWKLVCFIRRLPQLTEQDQQAMKKLNPKTPDELEEERLEEQFLNGAAPPAEPADTHHH